MELCASNLSRFLFSAGDDYSSTAIPITLSEGETRTCVRVPIRDDIILEDDEVFQVILRTNHINATVAGIAIANVTIADNDLGQLNCVVISR